MPGTETDRHGGSAVRSGRTAPLFPLRQMMERLWILGHLLYLSAEDIGERQISMLVILELGVTGLLYILASGHIPQPLPGFLLLLLGYVSREQIGYGDGWLMLALGMWLDFSKLLWMLFLGMGMGSLYACLSHKKELPLVPFLAAAYVIGEWL